MVYTEVNINAAPSEVREVVLDFDRVSDFHTEFIHAVESENGSLASSTAGDSIVVKVPYFQLQATIMINNESELRWNANTCCGLIGGEHFFLFLPSETIPGGTRFVHGEDHKGPTAFLFQPGSPMHGPATKVYNSYTQDVKRAIEERGLNKLRSQ